MSFSIERSGPVTDKSIPEQWPIRVVTLVREHADDLVRRLTHDRAEPILHDRAPLGMTSRATPWCAGFFMSTAYGPTDFRRHIKAEINAQLFTALHSLVKPLDESANPDGTRMRPFIEEHLGSLAHDLFVAARDPERLRALLRYTLRGDD
jgi:hypothetical protein